jgi:drug/metabolite transporter (DMT)-like permease
MLQFPWLQFPWLRIPWPQFLRLGFLWRSAWALLIAANLFWAGNIVLGRGLAGYVPPVTLAWCRWTGAFLIALPFAWPLLRRDLPAFRRHWPMMLLLSATGIASYNALSYIGLNSTTALNVLLLQSASPLVIIVWAFLLVREVPSRRQTIGVLLSLCGVVAIAAKGSLATLLALRINPGDIWVFVGICIYAPYCVIIRRRPAAHPFSFLTATMGIGSCLLLPFMLAEFAAGARIHSSAPVWAGIAYTAVMPSLVAYLFFNRALELTGPGPAGQSMHLMPLFGSILAVLFLHERFHAYHAAGIILIAAGILFASLPPLRRRITTVPARAPTTT